MPDCRNNSKVKYQNRRKRYIDAKTHKYTTGVVEENNRTLKQCIVINARIVDYITRNGKLRA